MTDPGSLSVDQARLDALRGSAKPKAGNARSIIALGANPRCGLRRLAQAARVDLAKVVDGTPFAIPSEQSPFALTKGNRWEQRLKADDYTLLLSVLRDAGELPPGEVTMRNLHVEFPHKRSDPYWSLQRRRAATREVVLASLAGGAAPLNLVDGAVLTIEVGGSLVYLELDGLAFRAGSQYRVVEIKSFSVVDGRADPGKVAEASQQAAVYVLALQSLIAELGYDRGMVNDEIFLIAARNVSMRPQLERLVVTGEMRSLARRLSEGADIAALVAQVEPGSAFFVEGETKPTDRIDRVAAIAGQVGTNYEPGCLSHCAMGWWCRDQSARTGAPACLGSSVARFLPEVPTLVRALDLATGASPTPAEEDAARLLRRASTLYDRALGISA